MSTLRNSTFKRNILLQSNPYCWICGKLLTLDTATFDHLVPRARGGSNTPSNIALACGKCNHSRDLDEITIMIDWQYIFNNPAKVIVDWAYIHGASANEDVQPMMRAKKKCRLLPLIVLETPEQRALCSKRFNF